MENMENNTEFKLPKTQFANGNLPSIDYSIGYVYDWFIQNPNLWDNLVKNYGIYGFNTNSSSRFLNQLNNLNFVLFKEDSFFRDDTVTCIFPNANKLTDSRKIINFYELLPLFFDYNFTYWLDNLDTNYNDECVSNLLKKCELYGFNTENKIYKMFDKFLDNTFVKNPNYDITYSLGDLPAQMFRLLYGKIKEINPEYLFHNYLNRSQITYDSIITDVVIYPKIMIKSNENDTQYFKHIGQNFCFLDIKTISLPAKNKPVSLLDMFIEWLSELDIKLNEFNDSFIQIILNNSKDLVFKFDDKCESKLNTICEYIGAEYDIKNINNLALIYYQNRWILTSSNIIEMFNIDGAYVANFNDVYDEIMGMFQNELNKNKQL